ncbi:MAG: ribosome-associated translation inhibitor RaiA [Oligoflexia bacterium]|nr:ribosome-associated translation inhibitor RaiA [Oligoflexia bacterium]MBF0364260.1 ribosome-associated translation inhibitor RaiA [Oligoflexia bacterium]
MKVTISFKNLEHTPALDEKIRQKSERFQKFLDGHTDVHWTCHVKEGSHCADLRISGSTFQYNASAESDNLYKCLDLAIHKIEKQLNKKKEKWKNKIHSKNFENADLLNRKILKEQDHNEDDDEHLDKVV